MSKLSTSLLIMLLAGTAELKAEVISPSDPDSVQRGIDAAYSRGDKSVKVPPGVYRFAERKGGSEILSFKRMKDFEIDTTGVTFVVAVRKKTSISFSECSGVTLRGATLIHDPVPFSQGEIIAITPNREAIDVRIDDGYPTDIDDARYFSQHQTLKVFDRETRKWKPGTNALSYERAERLAPAVFRFHFGKPYDQAMAVCKGDLVTWRGPAAADINLRGCARMQILDVTIKSGSGFCVHEGEGEGGNRYRYTVTYGPPPTGATKPPLLSANADAFHSSRMRRGPILENCLFEGMDDDGIPIHGTYAFVFESKGSAIVAGSRSSALWRDGDPIRFYNSRGAFASEARVTAVRSLAKYQPAQPAPKEFRNFQNSTGLKFYEITLDQPPTDIRFGCVAANPAACGRGFIVHHCTVRNNRARGMLIKADDGLIEDCTVEASTGGGIIVAPEMCGWSEADYTRHLIIRRNTIRHTGIWSQSGGVGQCGAITVAAYEHGAYVPLPGGHRDITIEENVFENNDGVNLLIASAQGVVVRNNRFRRPMQSVSKRPATAGLPSNSLVVLRNVDDVKFEGNVVDHPGALFAKPIDAENCSNITGIEDGVKVLHE